MAREVGGQSEIAEASIRVTAVGADDASRELAKARAEVERLAAELKHLKGAAETTAGATSGGTSQAQADTGGGDQQPDSSPAGGGGIAGLVGGLKRLSSFFGVSLGVRWFAQQAESARQATLALGEYQAKLNDINREGMRAGAAVNVSAQQFIVSSLGGSELMLRPSGPFKQAAGAARAAAVEAAQKEVNEARKAVQASSVFTPEGFLMNVDPGTSADREADAIEDTAVNRALFTNVFRLKEARANLTRTISQQSRQQEVSRDLIESADARARMQAFFGTVQQMGGDVRSQLLRIPR